MKSGGGQLKQSMGAADVIALGVSAAVGVSVFSITAPATRVAGPAMLIALAIAAVPMAVFVVVYAFLGSAVPRSGSSYDWPARFVHPYLGFLVSWLRILGNAGALHLMAVVFVSYLARAVAVPARPAMVVLLSVFYVINLVGVDVVGRVARGLVLLKVAALGTFTIIGLRYVHAAQFVPIAPNGTLGILAALPLLVGLYTGIESAAEAGEEIRNNKAVIGKGLAAATLIGMLVYFGTSVVAIGTLGPAAVAASPAPLLDAGQLFLGRWSSPLLIVTALASVAAAINATYLIFARFLFAMGRDGSLPGALARIHPKWGTPHVAITTVFVLGVIGLALPEGLVFLFLAANIPTVMKYFSNCWAAVRLVDRHPELYERAGFRVSRQGVRVWSYAGMLCALLILLSGLQADLRAYEVLGVWAALGTLYWLTYARHRSLSMRARSGSN